MAADGQGRRVNMGRFRPNMNFTKVIKKINLFLFFKPNKVGEECSWNKFQPADRGNDGGWSSFKLSLPIEQGELMIQRTIKTLNKY